LVVFKAQATNKDKSMGLSNIVLHTIALNKLRHHNIEYRSGKVGADEIGLLQISDSLFPTGMYAMSNGLDRYFYNKKVRNASQVCDLIKVFLTQQIGPTDCVNAYSL
jgi:hypothetical protein